LKPGRNWPILPTMGKWLDDVRLQVLMESHPVSRLRRFLLLCLKVVYHMLQKAWEDHFTRRAAALSFFTLLNLFPLAGLGLFLLSHSFLFKEHMASIESALVAQLVTPAARELVMDLFESLSKNLFVLGSGLSGLLTLAVLVILGTSLLVLVERSLNEVWRSPRGFGGLFSRVTMLWMGLTLMPILVGSSFALSAHFKKGWAQVYSFTHYGIPFLVTFVAFFTLYRFVPKVRFKLSAVLLSSLAAAVFWEAAKLGLSRYVEVIFAQSPVKKLYGSVALVPIGMVWIYYSWIIVLLGAELVYVLHNLEQLQIEARRRWVLGRGFVPLSRQAAIALLLDVYQSFQDGVGPVPQEDLAARYQLHPDQTNLWFDALASSGVITQTQEGRLLPSKPAHALKLRQIVELYNQKFLSLLAPARNGDQAWCRAEEASFLEAWGEKNLAELETASGKASDLA
jgi:membrane protein